MSGQDEGNVLSHVEATRAATGRCEGALGAYEAPRIDRLGSLADLTQGGDQSEDDTFGGAGASGSI